MQVQNDHVLQFQVSQGDGGIWSAQVLIQIIVKALLCKPCFFPVLIFGDFLWSCGCCNWRILRSKIENLDQCRNESVSFEYTKRFAPNMYRSAQNLSQYSCVWNWSTKPDVHIFNSVIIWFWWFSQQGSAQSNPEPQFLGTTLPLSSSHEFAHTSCGHAAKGLDSPDEHNHGGNGGEDVEEFCELYCLSRTIKRKEYLSHIDKSWAFLSPEVPWPLRLFEQQRLWVFQWLAWYPHSCSRLLHTQGW